MPPPPVTLHDTATPSTGLPFWSVTLTVKGCDSVEPIGPDCPVPETIATDAICGPLLRVSPQAATNIAANTGVRAVQRWPERHCISVLRISDSLRLRLTECRRYRPPIG